MAWGPTSIGVYTSASTVQDQRIPRPLLRALFYNDRRCPKRPLYFTRSLAMKLQRGVQPFPIVLPPYPRHPAAAGRRQPTVLGVGSCAVTPQAVQAALEPCSTSSHHTCACRQILPRADAVGRLGRIHAHWSLVLPCLGGASANEICMEITPTPGDSTCRAQGGGTKCAATSHQIPTRRGGDHGQGAKARRILRRQNVHAGGNGAFVGRSIWPATQS